ncbi:MULTISPECIES: undecaprenyldiphospho-muramoylpentapeptide beta-N-acetylglucosaminyltransferase [unclassified Undibacterium]|uniref:undecaprenyldiphospho-muramoylpentapeptide beta-N-acetylglucosaminyltransferase n=1 Tax=unclassified Undibacterium TaxID=2630295 RepID=UPI002AC91157|nr:MULTISPECIES: undecaprenyldiphospho-muramoylpentapeptide beta-N-acetylglucosaminyltransferase [unclassified Undibacterium]MEB0138657.1 undecaprenyldiphospho-muramoylpentapeptide beta-N-acetylglucosaminyltransferase [Undibacterium sp. CCC2.1]MEB0171458.1 undecaprenyldiphospho-muramoylpentapeptide beta-N-acetylglucosaminyltransferase [Undibacterium sp. CCC1.1]MEB0175788.1 undecaprenyldiphospho-muramoylpentapeptide beta-N-acetylglucosaminyltransferase [Undibacterium sp. CCC3.4]MEB0214383.1 unde
MSPLRHKKLLIMAAGTGGHIFPGLAIADLMRARGWEVSWLGTRTGMEAQIVPAHGIVLDSLSFSGLRGKGWQHTVSGAVKLVGSFFTCVRIMLKRRPDVVLGMGGYVTVPGGLVASLCGKPLVLMNADAVLLLSNRALRPFASKLLFGLPTAVKDAKALVSGNPIRSEICQLPPPQQRYAERSGPLRILVVGGSLGAKVLNDMLPQALALLAPEQRPQVTHQSGKQHIAALRDNYARAGVTANVVDFIDDMAQCYGAADLVVCRAGAITVSELTAAGVASILVPFMASSTSHQKQNAAWMAQHQAALCLPQSELTPAVLAARLTALSRADCLQLAQAAHALGERAASENIAKILESLV